MSEEQPSSVSVPPQVLYKNQPRERRTEPYHSVYLTRLVYNRLARHRIAWRASFDRLITRSLDGVNPTFRFEAWSRVLYNGFPVEPDELNPLGCKVSIRVNESTFQRLEELAVNGERPFAVVARLVIPVLDKMGLEWKPRRIPRRPRNVVRKYSGPLTGDEAMAMLERGERVDTRGFYWKDGRLVVWD